MTPKTKRRFVKFKLLLDEGLPLPQYFPKTNKIFNLKHLTRDFKLSGILDPEVYKLAEKKERIIVAFDKKGFRKHLKGKKTGIIEVSAKLKNEDIDKKLCALLKKSTWNQLYGKKRRITGETGK